MNAYRTDRSYLWNYEHGPSLRGPYPKPPEGPSKEFLGIRVRSRLGISAGILLNSRWIERYARLGFDILTYKTVRSAHRPCYPLPNWVYVEPASGRRGGEPCFRTLPRRPGRPRDVTSAVCFGMPSMDPAVWRADVHRARRALLKGQILIVSVVGTPRAGERGSAAAASLAEDFIRCARWAAAAGAHAVEANFSCPNVCTAEGEIYQEPRLVQELSRAIRDAIPPTPFLIKAGHFPAAAELRAFYRAAGGAADAIVLVNGVSGRVLTPAGRPAFPGHERVGVLGRAIHARAIGNVRAAVALSAGRDSTMQTAAVGGVLDVPDAADFFGAGAAAVLIGAGAALDPGLAARMKAGHPEW